MRVWSQLISYQMSCPTKETEAAVRAGAEYVAYRKTIDFESRAVATFANSLQSGQNMTQVCEVADKLAFKAYNSCSGIAICPLLLSQISDGDWSRFVDRHRRLFQASDHRAARAITSAE